MAESQPTTNQQGADEKQVSPWVLRYRRFFIVVAHLVLFGLSLLLAFAMAANFRFTDDWFTKQFLPILPVVLLIKLVVFWFFGLYHGWWRYVSLQDLIRITKATHVSTFLFVVAFFSATSILPRAWPNLLDYIDLERFRQVVLLLDWLGTIALVCGARIAVRLYHEEFRQVSGGRLIRLLIVGAGDCGGTMLREIHRMPVERYEVVGLLDDDPRTHGASLYGARVLGGTDRIKDICEKHSVEEVLIALPSASPKQIRSIVERCAGTNVRFRTVPAVADLISGKIRFSQIRQVDINDLLGREPVQLDCKAIEAYLHGRVVMITGAGGSIGAEMCRQIARFKPARLVLIEQAENALFDIKREMDEKFPDLPVASYICDICDEERVNQIFQAERPYAVFHAAAHKHVPLMEENPTEAIKNNVFGTKAVSDAAARFGCHKFVMISTDKAVNPTSIMGCSKRVAEMYIQNLARPGGTQFVTVRFGNVLGSTGSVVPIFRQQIANGGPVTVTHPEMRRYFMTIPEASQLVMQAAAIGSGGEIFLLDMGEPVKIVDLARDLITLSGFTPGEDIEIVFTGVRPGEKLFEELSIKGEDMAKTSHEKIAVWQKRPAEKALLEQGLGELARLAANGDEDGIRRTLKKLVPEFQPNGNGAPAETRPPAEHPVPSD